MNEPTRVVRWLTGDMRALATFVDVATATALADSEVRSARQQLMRALEAGEHRARATQSGTDATSEPAGQER
jgi:hypothetical protein